MDFDKFQTLFLSQLKINDERCLETIDSNIELIEVYLGEKGNQKIIRNFTKEISDIIFNSKNLTGNKTDISIDDIINIDTQKNDILDILQNDLYKKVLSHPSFSYILRILDRTFKLIRACKNKNIGDANSYQMLEICPYIQDSNGVSTLMYAGELNLNYAIERYLDDARALNIEDNDGNNLLFYCVRNPYFVSNDLVSNNKYGNDLVHNSEIDINHVNHQGESVLIYCAKNEIIKPITKFLIHCNNIDPNIVDNDGKTAAMYLTEKGHTYELLGLYRRNCNYDYINEKGQSALSILFDKLYTVEDSTSYSNYIRVLSIFTKYQCDFNNAIDIDGNTPFMLTLIVNDMDTAKYLIKSIRKLDLSVKNKFGENAISLCYKLGRYELLPLLKENPTFNCNYRDQMNQNSLLMISAINNPLAMKELLENDPSIINEVNAKNENALIIATKINQANSMDTILKYGIDINHQDNLGNTALHYAVELYESTIINKLMQNKPNINLKNNEGKSPLDYANEMKDPELINALTNPNQTIKSNKKLNNNKYSEEIQNYLTQNINNYYPMYKLTKEKKAIRNEVFERNDGISFKFFCNKWEIIVLLVVVIFFFVLLLL